MRDLTSISDTLFNKIRSRFENVTLGDENAKATQDPEIARFFNFDYIVNNNNYGNVTISISDENIIKIYFSKNITEELTSTERKDWYSFLYDIRRFAKQNLLGFDTHDLSRGNLEINDIKTIAQIDAPEKSHEVQIGESRMYGSKKRSYEKVGEAKIIVRHSAIVDEEVRGSRSRKIGSIFIETSQGERFKLPFTKLNGARAMAQHVTTGGQIGDPIGSAITEMVAEMSDMKTFVRKTNRRQFEDATTTKMVEAARSRYQQVRETLGRMSKHNGYVNFAESFVAEEGGNNDYNEQDMIDRFSKTTFDSSLQDALPRVHNAYVNHSNRVEAAEAKYSAGKAMIESADFALDLQESDLASFVTTMAFEDTNVLVSKVLEDISTRATDENIREFASVWAEKVNSLNEDNDEIFNEDKSCAVQLATQYIKGIKEGRFDTVEKEEEYDEWYDADGNVDPNGAFDAGGHYDMGRDMGNYEEKDEFTEWAESIAPTEDKKVNEGTWSLPDDVPAAEELRNLLSNPIEAGVDGDNAANTLYDLIGDDDLFDSFHECEPDEDVRPIVRYWLEEYLNGNSDYDYPEIDQEVRAILTPLVSNDEGLGEGAPPSKRIDPDQSSPEYDEIVNHPRYHINGYSYFKGRGYSDQEILDMWSRPEEKDFGPDSWNMDELEANESLDIGAAVSAGKEYANKFIKGKKKVDPKSLSFIKGKKKEKPVAEERNDYIEMSDFEIGELIGNADAKNGTNYEDEWYHILSGYQPSDLDGMQDEASRFLKQTGINISIAGYPDEEPEGNFYIWPVYKDEPVTESESKKATYSDYAAVYRSQAISGTDSESDAKAMVKILNKQGKDADLKTAKQALRRMAESNSKQNDMLEMSDMKRLAGL